MIFVKILLLGILQKTLFSAVDAKSCTKDTKILKKHLSPFQGIIDNNDPRDVLRLLHSRSKILIYTRCLHCFHLINSLTVFQAPLSYFKKASFQHR